MLAARPLLAILPTGAGKSLCYQLPAMLLPGLVLVVSPLLALMRDQLDRLPAGLPGAMLWGGQTRSEADEVIADAARGALKLLYVAPEKLLSPVVLTALLRLPQGISLVGGQALESLGGGAGAHPARWMGDAASVDASWLQPEPRTGPRVWIQACPLSPPHPLNPLSVWSLVQAGPQTP